MHDPGFLQDIFPEAGHVTVRKMFGGQGIYCTSGIFAVVIEDDAICVKGDAVSLADYESLGMQRWGYTNPKTGKVTLMPYWRLPDEALDDPDLMARLTRLAVGAAQRSQLATKSKKR